VRLIPGSHDRVYPTSQPTGDPLTDSVEPDLIDEAGAIDMELAPGEFFLFNEKLLHCSGANRSTTRRLGLAIRLTIPAVRVDHAQLLGGRHRNMAFLTFPWV